SQLGRTSPGATKRRCARGRIFYVRKIIIAFDANYDVVGLIVVASGQAAETTMWIGFWEGWRTTAAMHVFAVAMLALGPRVSHTPTDIKPSKTKWGRCIHRAALVSVGKRGRDAKHDCARSSQPECSLADQYHGLSVWQPRDRHDIRRRVL